MILPDTHAALRLDTAPEKLSRDATRAIGKAALVHDLPLVTKDRGLLASPLLRTVW